MKLKTNTTFVSMSSCQLIMVLVFSVNQTQKAKNAIGGETQPSFLMD